MNRNDILLFSSVTNQGVSVFRAIMGKVKNLNLSLAIITFDKKVKAEAENLREVLKEKEPPRLEEIRQEMYQTKDETERKRLNQEYEIEYADFLAKKEIKEWLNEEVDLKFQTHKLDKAFVKNAGFDTDQVEMLMNFTDIEELISEPKTTEPTKKTNRK